MMADPEGLKTDAQLLDLFTDAELQAELDRRAERRVVRSIPSWTCQRCGAIGYFDGPFSKPRFERQAEEFQKTHRNCPLSTHGGGI